MATAMPMFQASLLSEGWSKKGTEAVLAQALRLDEDSDNPGLIYISSELVANIKDCEYSLGYDTSYRNCQ
jgi:hypothetical protein